MQTIFNNHSPFSDSHYVRGGYVLMNKCYATEFNTNLPFFSEKCPVFGYVKLKLLNNYSMQHHFKHLHIATKDCSSYCDYNTITNQAEIMAVCHEHALQSRFIFKQHTTKAHAAEACDISYDHIWLTSHLKITHDFL